MYREMIENLNFMTERVLDLEKKSLRISAIISSFESPILNSKLSFRGQIADSLREVEDLNKRLDSLHIKFKSLSSVLKSIVKQEEFERLKRQVDDYQFENLITIDELKKQNWKSKVYKLFILTLNKNILEA